MRKMVLLLAIMLSLAGCTDADKTMKVLRAQGYKDICVTGYRWLSCGNDDQFHTGFKAVSSSGTQVTGTVCSGWFKGATVRFD